MAKTLTDQEFQFPGQTSYYHGKVREVYGIGQDHLLMIVSDRISAFDYVLPKGIPYKGQVLNQLAQLNMEATADIVPNWLESTPDPNVSYGIKCEPFKIEMVIRAYLAGHAWREYKAGRRQVSGAPMPDGLKESDAFPEPIITPATKAEQGLHDEDISREDILSRGIVSEEDYLKLEAYTRALFQRGSEKAKEQGLILVDTKYEFGKDKDGVIRLIDEVHTPDSSRYYYLEGYEERQERGEHQRQLSKEFVREWLMENNFQGLEGQTMPLMPDDFVNVVTDRYIELYEKLSGTSFQKDPIDDIGKRIEENVSSFLR
ncbi:phosphoribosylaminoimidazolesuccinocarboxamide synthase [Salibacteraceae bacterium]|jgi:phosphoribosylaminoimidazole-succinocarboxamide synthase|nr:phosphoribosylaminoimidazolesuccinocarboxamide synthase [Salibacteraceae bacterium]